MDLLITITPIEGCTNYLTAENFNTFEEANRALGRLSIVHNAPERGNGYLKTKVSVGLYGLDFEFRYHMVEYGAEDGGLGVYPDLRQTLINRLLFYVGENCPQHMEPEAYRAFLYLYAKGVAGHCKELLEKLEAVQC